MDLRWLGSRRPLRGGVRVALLIASQLGQHAAIVMAPRLAEQQRANEQQARELRTRCDAQLATARMQVAVVQRSEMHR